MGLAAWYSRQHSKAKHCWLRGRPHSSSALIQHKGFCFSSACLEATHPRLYQVRERKLWSRACKCSVFSLLPPKRVFDHDLWPRQESKAFPSEPTSKIRLSKQHNQHEKIRQTLERVYPRLASLHRSIYWRWKRSNFLRKQETLLYIRLSFEFSAQINDRNTGAR